jgi:hypothetical protein
LSDVKADGAIINSPARQVVAAPLKPCASAKKAATSYSSSKFVPRVSKQEVEATDEGRASVDKLSAWLASESAKKAKKPPTIVPAPNPVRFRMKPKINKEDVEATDDKRVSVKTLSAWISDDPFEQKKLRHIRSGVRVINKSRVFEPDKKKVDVQVVAGSVHEKQAWLSGAFKHEDGRPQIVHKDKTPVVKSYQNKPKADSPDKSLMTVSEKKAWLNNAFKKADNDIQPTRSFDSMTGAPGISTCVSADGAKEQCECPAISHRASYDGATIAPPAGNQSPVRLYKKCDVEGDSLDSCLKTVHDKQEWLANAFKAHPVQKQTPLSVPKEAKAEAEYVATEEESTAAMKSYSNQEEEKELDQNAVSVADRAKWLRGAFSK